MKLRLLLTTLILTVLFSSNIFGQVIATAPTGSGTEGAPYQIRTISHLLWVSLNPDKWDKYFIQTANIDASNTQYWDDINDNSPFDNDPYDDPNDGTSAGNNEGFPPIGRTGEVVFSGFYDGQGYSISNLTINRGSTDYVGLFGRIQDNFDRGVYVSNLYLIDISFTGKDNVGGLSGEVMFAPITNCFSTGTINGSYGIGGLIGNCQNSTISRCYSKCNITSTSSGGLGGGLVAYLGGSAIVQNSFSKGNVSALGTAGGLIGYNNNSTVENCYSTGAVSGSYKGGLVGGSVSGTVTNSFWDKQTSGQSTSAGGTGKTTLQMKDVYTYLDVGWDFVVETNNGTNNYWDDDANESLNSGYPVLFWQSGADGTLGPFYSGGSGTSGDPYLISTTADLVYLSQHSVHWTYYFKQTANLSFNLSETLVDWNGDGIADGSGTPGFTPIGNSTDKFTGTYDGQGHIISNLFIDRATSSYIGLFGAIWGGDILNVGVENVDFTGTNTIGGLVGNSGFSSNISNCFSTGTIVASGSSVGGLVGTNASSTIRDCYSRVDVTGNSNVGGFIGYMDYTTLSNSYSAGTVSGSSYVGGFIGFEENSSISNCFWDTESSGQSSSRGGIGETTANMTYYKTFTDAGWDFVTEGVNGTNDYWDADQEGTVNDGYMILAWEDGADDVYRKYLTGNGTESNPYQISSPDDLLYLSLHSNDWDKHFAQVSHITFDTDPNNVDWDLDEVPEDLDDYVGFKPIGNATTPFTGVYDGYAHYIANLFINRAVEDYVGFFGYTNGATIEKLGLHNVDIYGSRNIGALVGRALNSTISESYNTGSVESNVATGDYIGGFVGVNSTSSITNCYSRASVTGGDDYVGGLVGLNNSSSTIDKCYSTGLVTGDQSLGGLVGSNSATVTNSFWDTQTSGQATSSGGTGKSTADMKLNSTFLDAGWDANIWNMDAAINNGYPYLDWVIPGGNPLPVELTSFTATSTSSASIVLNWSTATEINNYGFEIERQLYTELVEVNNWEKIGFVEGHGNSNSPKDYSFVDNSYVGNISYRLKQIDIDGGFEYSDVVEVVFSTASEYSLSQNNPNPFNPSTNISFTIPQSGIVKLNVYNILGEVVSELVNENLDAGLHTYQFDASNLTSGIYFYSISVNGFTEVKKMNLIK